MINSLRLLSLTAVVAAVALGPGAARVLACGNSQGYSSTSIGGSSNAFGISAQIAQTSTFDILNGSVGGWVMVGGKGEGPLGSNEWLQAGYAAFPSVTGSDIYYEVGQPGQYPRYHEISTGAAVGMYTQVTVLEMHKRPNSWRVWVNHRPVSPPIKLPGSHDGLKATAKSESWDGGTGACNDFSYSFRRVSIAHGPGGDWQQLKAQPDKN
jgi:hypothetical protein